MNPASRGAVNLQIVCVQPRTVSPSISEGMVVQVSEIIIIIDLTTHEAGRTGLS
jgi:hypothetical protein